VGFEVRTEVAMKSPIFWDIISCVPLKVKRIFGEIFHLHLQRPRICQARNWLEEAFKQNSSILKIEAAYSSETPVDF
jgi:hypothetical protein